jgi:ribosomal protein L4
VEARRAEDQAGGGRAGQGNLPRAKYIAPEGVNVYDVLDHEALVLTQGAAKALEQRLLPGGGAA